MNKIFMLNPIKCCPKCKSSNVKDIFYISTITHNVEENKIEPKSVCDDCKYFDLYGNFERDNFINCRNSIIDELLQ